SSPTIHAGLTVLIITRNAPVRAIVASEKTRLRAQSVRLLHERHGCEIVVRFSPFIVYGKPAGRRPRASTAVSVAARARLRRTHAGFCCVRDVAACSRQLGAPLRGGGPLAPRNQTRSASLRRSSFLRSLGSSSFLRRRIDFGVTSTSSSSWI